MCDGLKVLLGRGTRNVDRNCMGETRLEIFKFGRPKRKYEDNIKGVPIYIYIYIYKGKSLPYSALLTQYCAGDKIEKNEMGWACVAYG